MVDVLTAVAFNDPEEKEIVACVPAHAQTMIANGASLIVAGHQRAMVVAGGRVHDMFGPGNYQLSPATLPVFMKNSGMNPATQVVPIQVLFINATPMADKKWGTKNPGMIRDTRFGSIPVRAFGSYGLRIVQPLVFVNTLVLTQKLFTGRDVENFIRDILGSVCAENIGKAVHDVAVVSESYATIADTVLPYAAEYLKRHGIELREFKVTNVNIPDEIQQMIDDNAVQSEPELAATTIKKNNDESVLPLGIGAGLGMLLPGMMYGADSIVSDGVVACAHCNEKVAAGNTFCPKCGRPMTMREEMESCPSCHSMIAAHSKFCPKCGANLSQKACVSCGATMGVGDVFCPQCGKKN